MLSSMSKLKDKSINSSREVTVKDAFKQDVGKGFISIDNKVVKALHIHPGDVIEIVHPLNNKRTAAIFWRGYKEEKCTDIIRIDSSIRRNLNASIDDIVRIAKIQVSIAERITFAGLEEPTVLRNTQQLAEKLENRVITKGDILSFYAMGSRVDLVVIDYSPKAMAVIVGFSTKITLSPKSHKELEELEKLESNRVTYKDIGGLGKEIMEIREILKLAMANPNLFKQMGIEPPKGILLHGPPGIGKTLLAKVIGYEYGPHFISINSSEIISKFYGETEEKLKDVFQNAKLNEPSIIFIDHIEVIALKLDEISGSRDLSILTELLILLDGLESRGRIIVIGATNRPEILDPAILRPGRFDRIIELKLPDGKGRLEIFKIHSRDMRLEEDLSFIELSNKTDGFTGADISAVCREALIFAVKRFQPSINLELAEIDLKQMEKIKISNEDFEEAIKKVASLIEMRK